MALHLSCPACGEQFDLLQAMEDADGRRLLDVVKDMQPIVIRPFFRYLKLFKPVKRGLRWSRMLTLAQELVPMISAAQIQRNGVTVAVPPDSWVNAMNELIDQPPKTLKLPLKGHGYLLSILAGNAENAAAAEEQRIEKHRQQRRQEGAARPPQPISSVMNPDEPKPEDKKPAGWAKQRLFSGVRKNEDE